MLILLQKTDGENILKAEQQILKEIMHRNKYVYEYIPLYLHDMATDGTPANYPKYYQDAVPIGTIEFVNRWLKIFHGCLMNPVEIPECLQRDEFLKRDYRIVPFHKVPREGSYFIKDVSQLKRFSSCLYKRLEYMDFEELEKSGVIDKSHLFQVSDRVPYYSEYRAYFIDGELENLCQYNGDLMHYPDVDLLLKANAIYSREEHYPKSYTMDVMVSARGTHIVEIHPFACVGLYHTIWTDRILYAYRDGIDYYVNHNVPCMPTRMC